MTSKALTYLLCAVVGVTMLCVGGLLGLSGAALACSPSTEPADGVSVRPPGDTLSRYDAEQLTNAEIITSVGVGRGIRTRGEIIAVATAIQESSRRNLGDQGPANDQDSLGLFQQRPSQGWGTPEQLVDPVYAAGRFYDKLLAIPGWEQMPLTQAAQAVQHSAHPDAYAKWEADATALVALVVSGNWQAIPGDLEQCPINCPGLLSNDEQSSPDPGCLRGAAVLAPAQTWLTAWDGGPVPYLSGADPATWFSGYRRDCSGYVSMALGLPGPGLDTAGLAAHSTPIAKTDLRAGDLLINPAPGLAGHVVIFDHWTDATMTSYVGYEQSGDGRTHHRVIPYPYFAGYPQMSPYRVLASSISRQPLPRDR